MAKPATITVDADALRIAAELLVDNALSFERTHERVFDALTMLDALKAAGVGCAAELCRDELTELYRSLGN